MKVAGDPQNLKPIGLAFLTFFLDRVRQTAAAAEKKIRNIFT